MHRTLILLTSFAIGVNAATLTVPGDYASIAAAHTAASAGDVIAVSSNTLERVAVTKSSLKFIGSGLPVTRGFALSDVTNVSIIGFEITHTSTTYSRGITLGGVCRDIDIVDNYIHETYQNAIHGSIGATPSHITIRGNTLYYIGCVPGVATNPVAAIANSYTNPHNWLVEYNVIQRSGDFINLYGTNHIVRNNYLYDFDDAYFPAEPATHSDMFQPGSDGAYAFSLHHFYERNFVGDSVEVNSHFGIWQDTVGAGDTNHIIRGNVAFNFGSGGVGVMATDKVATYNNTFYKMLQAGSGNVFVWYESGEDYALAGLCANTIIYDDGSGTDALYIQAGSAATLTHNLGYLAGTESSYVSTSDPLFVGATTNVFRLQAESPAIDAGTNLVWITSADSSGTSFDVNDGQLLCDGWGIAEGDVITTGGTTTRITGIADNTVTVAASVTWTNLQPVYWGTDTTPDIGALPYGSTELTAATISANGTTYTVTPTGDARGVWFYVDGIPTTWDYDAPYQQTIASGTVTAKAYALYAQETPVIAATDGAAPTGNSATVGTLTIY